MIGCHIFNMMSTHNPMAPTASPALTPAQSRAGRALLAWSQKELADTAGIATSTVADFERGHRTPIPQNAEAIRSALENAGISFRAGGAVIGPPLPALAATSKSGAPIRWVDATDIAQWAERRDGQGSLPTLLAKLVRATGPSSLRFPSDEGVQYAGWDGTTNAPTESEYVPAGTAGWEIGTQREDIAGKATDDYNKRTEDPLGLNPAESTFIFVTPRHWPKKDEWAREKRAQGIWRDVRAYDGADLVHWIELYPAVGQWLATSFGKRPAGARQLEEIWLEWSLATQWQLTTDLILSDRDEDAVALLRWLRSAPSSLALQAETPEEVAGFVYATISQLPPDAAEHYLARCLVAGTPDVARMLADSVTPLIIVLLEPEPGLAQIIAQRGHHVLVAYGQNPSSRGVVRKLERPSREGIEAALTAAGLPEKQAKGFAHESSRSLAILRRLIPGMPGRLPVWVQSAPSRSLLAALLAGAWDEGSDTDKAVLSRLADMPYDAFATAIAPFAGNFDSPLRKVGTIWKVASPQDAWFLLAPQLSATDIDKFEAVAVDVLGAADPRYVMSPDERWYAPIRGIKPEYSEYLRHGLGEVLILLAMFGDRAQAVPDAAKRADLVVRKLLHGADKQRWWSLSRDFQLLAEAAPTTFLTAVEDSLDKNDPPIAALFGTDGDPLFGGEHLSSLLWALESLAWAPEYLGRITNILGRLDELDPGGRYMNRPANSLRTTYLLWSPQTNANLSQRLRALDQLRKRLPDPAWKLMLGILPGAHDSFSPAPLTRWRDLSGNNVEVVTYALIDKGARAIVERLLADVGSDAPRWITLLERWGNFGTERAAAMAQLKKTIKEITDEDSRAALRSRIRRVLHHNRSFRDSDWALPKSELAQLESVYDALAPADPTAAVAWLFEPSVSLPNPVGGWEKHDEQLRKERRKVAKVFLKERGVDALFALVAAVKEAGYLGAALVESRVAKATCGEILHRALKSDKACDHNLAHGMIVTLFPSGGETWAQELLALARREAWGDKAILTALLALPSGPWTWSQAAECGSAIEVTYWERAPVVWMKGDEAEATFAIEKLISVGRARHAVHLVGFLLHQGKHPPSELLVKLLLEALRQPMDENTHDNDKTMFQHYVTEILKRLDKAADVPTEKMLQLEWTYLPLLEHSDRPAKVIMSELASNPGLFVQLISAVYKPSDDSGVVDTPPENEEQARNIATQAYRLLRLWTVIPGTMADGKIDGAALEAWVKEARKLAKAAGRDAIAEQKIGEVLSASKIDDDGVWPAVPIRELIETIRSSEMETGFVIGRHNRRGITTRLPSDGGAQERTLVETYRGWSKATAFDWPRTSAILENLARSYEEDARREDERAERLDWRQ
jgi:transcriptional regulator with XRE-family HTH domain